MRLDKYLMKQTRHGRREVRALIERGLVRCDDLVITDRLHEVGRFGKVELDGAILMDRTARYLMLNKPAGYLSATTDPEHPTVMQLVDDDPADPLHLAGRLDRASTGLLILTNDGQWSRRLTEPDHQIDKVYQVTVEHPLTDDLIEVFQQGMYFAYEDVMIAPAELEILSDHSARVTIHEGKYHQIKRMFHAVENRITSLHRLSMGEIQLDPQLQAGQWRHLSAREIDWV
ncbi:16S rRNA pseudouridine(516) synthase [Persicirhabdus sediminis]|uniref:Pseudouridine synthase n=2 Tax=Persicirhabdus sediminis TaxID=454144 RepID=A0A8J7MBZ9_9BACT|nr:16S rRNA pseudouridine(516) synthase [Persicirhabdus sediminis]